MRIGSITIAHRITLAPMEEHTNYPFRLLMKQAGASLVVTERVDACDVAQGDRRAMRLLYTTPSESPRAGQISGGDPATMAAAAQVVAELGFNIVDLNFECPIRRLMGRGEGGALMAEPGRIEQIVAAVVRAVKIPVTLKIRTGPSSEVETAPEVSQRAEAAGAAAVSVHARSVGQAYIGGPDWSVLERVKKAVGIPVMGNGGVRQASDVIAMLNQTGVDAVAIGRGCLGNPAIFSQARALLFGGRSGPAPTLAQRGRALLQLVEGEFHIYGQPLALRRLPRTCGYFAQGIAEETTFRAAVRKVTSLGQFRRLVRDYFG
jgi:nifR3 family TIM-barrel protein